MEVPECKICYKIVHRDEKRKPRILSCGHTFCSNCLKNLIKDGEIECSNCHQITELYDDSIEQLTVNFQVLDFSDNYCFSEYCTNRVVDAPNYSCSHCSSKICVDCAPKHFEEYKKTSLDTIRELVHKFGQLSANAKNIRSFVKSDREWIMKYKKNKLNKIKNGSHRLSVQNTIDEFFARINEIFQAIEKERLIIDDNLKISEEIIKTLEELSFDFNSLDKETDDIRRIHSIKNAINELENYTPKSIDPMVNIKDNIYQIENPIITYRNEWIRYELDINNFDGNFDPEKLFEVLRKDAGKKTIQVAIGVVGRAGVGKSSFLNAFYGLNPDDDNYILTDFVECTFKARPYYVDKEKYENLVIWDTPGVGTVNFQFEAYRKIIEHINCDAFVYLYDTQFNEVDKQVLEMIRKRTLNRVFICRTKVDNDYKRIAEKAQRLPFNNMTKEKKESYFNRFSSEYKDAFDKLKEKYENDRKNGNVYLKEEKEIFYVSNVSKYRNLFEFDDFLLQLYKSLPEVQGDIIIDEIKTKSISLLEKKKDIIEREIDHIVSNMVYRFDTKSQFKNWLNAMLQEFARRLAMNEIFKKLDDSDVDKILNQIEQHFPIKLKAIKNTAAPNESDIAEVKMDIDIHIFFALKNFGTKEFLIKKTSEFLKENLNILLEHGKDIIANNYIAGMRKN